MDLEYRIQKFFPQFMSYLQLTSHSPWVSFSMKILLRIVRRLGNHMAVFLHSLSPSLPSSPFQKLSSAFLAIPVGLSLGGQGAIFSFTECDVTLPCCSHMDER